MPYIKQERRDDFFNGFYEPANPGELNYMMTAAALTYIKARGSSYRTYNDVLGVLTAMQHEIYRRLIGPYEDGKIQTNGDVF